MAKRRLPARPNVEHLRHEARQLLNGYIAGKADAVADFEQYLPQRVHPGQLSDAQLVLARSYSFPGWTRLKQGAELCRAIDDQDVATVERLVVGNPALLIEGTRGLDTRATWGTPLTYASRSNKPEVVDLLVRLSGKDATTAHEASIALGLQQLGDWFLQKDGTPKSRGVVMHPCETLNARGLDYLISHGARIEDQSGNTLAPVAMILQTYSRSPDDKHRALELCNEHGAQLPDTPMMSFHRGRVDLLEAHIRRDNQLIDRRWQYGEIYPVEVGCGASDDGLHATPIGGCTLLHLCGEFGEVEIANYLMEKGANPNAPADINAGFGGHTPIYNTVVTLALRQARDVATLLLTAGADLEVEANIRKQLRYHADESVHEYLRVSPIAWGESFHDKSMVSKEVMSLLQETQRS
jgi:hypothetical protein